jgi:ribonuclease R
MILGPGASSKAASSPAPERSNPEREENDNTPTGRVPRIIPVRSAGFGGGKKDSAKDKPQLSKKLMFAERSKLQDNDENSEKNGDSLKNGKPDRKDAEKRGKTQDNRRGLRKTRVSPGRGKGKAR